MIYPGLGDFSDWDENIFAGYANLVRITPRYTLEGGLRLEETQVSYTIPAENIYYPGSDRYDYFGVFPNAKLTLNLTSTNRLTMAFNRRVDRPGEPELRIFPKYDDPEILKVGNPFLRPQFTNAYEVGFSRSWVGGTGSAAVYHRDVSDAFLRIFAIDDSNPSYDIVNRIFENAGNFRQTGVQEIILATNPNLEGEATALYLARLLRPLGLRITRIARGLPDTEENGRAAEGGQVLGHQHHLGPQRAADRDRHRVDQGPVDQHVAHERILFDKFRQKESARQIESQNLLLPETIDLTPAQSEAFRLVEQHLIDLGFDEVGFAAVLVSPDPELALAAADFPVFLQRMVACAG